MSLKLNIFYVKVRGMADDIVLKQVHEEADRSHLLKVLVTTLVEAIPGGIGPYGIGDIVTLMEGLAGVTLDGLHLTSQERLFYYAASLIPGIPARPFIFIYRMIRGR